MTSFHLIYKLIPVPVFWTDMLLKEWQGGAVGLEARLAALEAK